MVEMHEEGRRVCLKAAEVAREVTTANGRRNIVKSFSYEFHEGLIYTIVGPSGAGKSSLLRLFNRLDEKSSGEIHFFEQSLESYPVTDLRRKIALVFQTPYLFAGTVASNLALCCDDKTPADSEFIASLLKRVGLDPEMARRNPDNLSVGQKQRVALARTLAMNPQIVMLDEPTSALDPSATKTIEELIVKLNRDLKLTILMVTHNFEQALRLKGISLLLAEGQLIESGPSEEILKNPESDKARKFVNGDLHE